MAEAGDTYWNRFSRDSKHNKGKYKRLAKKCDKCGTTDPNKTYDIDHRDGNRKNNNRSNLRVLCRSCHRKMHAKRNGGKGELIISSAARIIDEPPEAQAIAQEHQNSDLMHVEFILCHANTNGNQDTFTSEDLKLNSSTAEKKPLNRQHTNINIGVIYESKYVDVSELLDEEKAYYSNFDSLEYDFVLCKAAVWESKHPVEARIIRERAARGDLVFSMENQFSKAKCSECGGEYDRISEYCDHLLSRHETKQSSRIFVNSNFIGAAYVDTPADKGAKMISLAGKLDNSAIESLIKYKIVNDISMLDTIIPYIIAEGNVMDIRKLNIPSKFVVDSDLPDELFADNINRVFPIDNLSNVEQSARAAFNNKLDFYSDVEKLIVLEKIAKACKEYDLDMNDYKGGKMDFDVNHPDIQKAIEAKASEMFESYKKEQDFQGQIKSLNDSLAEAKKQIEELNTSLESEKESKAQIEKEFEEFKDKTEKESIASKRMSVLSENGFDFEEIPKFVDNAVRDLDDEGFASFIETLKQTQKISSEAGEKKAKASLDPVNESKTEIQNKVEKNESKYPALDAYFGEEDK